jgi:hypothetical protein
MTTSNRIDRKIRLTGHEGDQPGASIYSRARTREIAGWMEAIQLKTYGRYRQEHAAFAPPLPKLAIPRAYPRAEYYTPRLAPDHTKMRPKPRVATLPDGRELVYETRSHESIDEGYESAKPMGNRTQNRGKGPQSGYRRDDKDKRGREPRDRGIPEVAKAPKWRPVLKGRFADLPPQVLDVPEDFSWLDQFGAAPLMVEESNKQEERYGQGLA